MRAAGCSALLMVDVFTNKFYSLAEKQLLSLGGDHTERLGGGGGDYAVVGSSHGWIALFTFDNLGLELFLWKLVSRRCINLPPFNNLPTLKHRLEGEFYPAVITKLILSSSNPDDADCRVVVLYGPGDRLAFCCPGQSGADWISIGLWYHHYANDRVEFRSYADMAYSSQQNRLFCIGRDHPHHELERWDLEDPWSPRIDGDDRRQRREEVIYQYEHNENENEGRSIYLVTTDQNEVLVVVRKLYSGRKWRDNFNDPHKTTGFMIFKVVQGEGANLTVHPLHSLDSGLAMFVGLNHSFALSATQFPEFKPNSIYFTDAYLPIKSDWWRSVCCLSQYDIGIFDFQSRIFYPCYSPQEHNHGSEKHNAQESTEEDINDGSDEDNDGNAE